MKSKQVTALGFRSRITRQSQENPAATKNFTFEATFRKAVEPVGKAAFHTLCKLLSEGLPPDDPQGRALWDSDLTKRELSDIETSKAAALALAIEEQAFKSILRTLAADGFLEAISSLIETAHAQAMAKQRSKVRTDPFTTYLKRNPDISSKEIVRTMEAEGIIEAHNDYYLIVNQSLDRSEWPKVKLSSMPSKLSRLRRKLRNA
ncbi:MAG: hypothetical protein AB7U63_00760 [Porticoccaceae bacterium]